MGILSKFDAEKIAPWTAVIIIFVVFSCIFVSFLSDFLFYFDFAPASGTVTGYISYQEKSGIWGLEHVCWRDTSYDYCEIFDPAGVTYAPGKYLMNYNCTKFSWAWEKPGLCTIINATKIGEV
jgi:hypothetical protein